MVRAKRDFLETLRNRWDDGCFMCVGLDPVLELIPSCCYTRGGIGDIIRFFNTVIIEATRDLACAYKVNPAYYLGHGDAGFDALQKTISYVVSSTDALLIFDGKHGDVSHSNAEYAGTVFTLFEADAVTVSPYCGFGSLKSFFQYPSRGVFVLCRSSGGISEVQDATVNGEPMYSRIARYVIESAGKWDGHPAFIVGGTHPDAFRRVRDAVGDAPILVPGIGAQGGDIVKIISTVGITHSGKGIIPTSSRNIIYASCGGDFAEAARREVEIINALFDG